MVSYKWWVFVAVSLFVMGFLFGLATPADIGGAPIEETELKKLADFLAPLPQHTLFVFIFLKNVAAILVSLAFSPLFLLVPIAALTFNGWLLGWVANTVIAEKSLGYLLAGLLPHGIIELPALFLGEAFALKFGMSFLFFLFKKERSGLRMNLRRDFIYLMVSLALFLPAALIETYITPLFLGQ